MSNPRGQAQTGALSSMPKICKVSGDDNMKMVWKNMGNNHNVPFIWAETVVVSGTEAVVASGIRFHGTDLAAMANVTITPLSDVGASARVYVDKDTTLNQISIKSTASINMSFDVKIMIGVNDPDISTISCRGNTGASPNF